MQSFTGKVVSARLPTTVGVEVLYAYQHPKYKKIIKKTTKLLVHNEIEGVKEGDTVRVEKSRPYSKRKHFKVTGIIK